LLIETANATLTPHRFARALRARRSHLPYLRRLLEQLDRDDRETLARRLCETVTARMDAPRLAKRLAQMQNAS